MTLHAWLEQNYAKLQKYALYQCQGDPEQAHDLLQEVIMAVLSGRYSLDITQAPLTRFQQMMKSKKWRILHGADKVRQNQPYTDGTGKTKVAVTWLSRLCLTGDEWLTARAYEPPEPSRTEQISECLARLPTRYQVIMQLRMQGLTYQEIASQLHVNPSSVGATVQKGVKLLKALVLSAGDE